jgi:hypothetical protein
MAAYVHHWVIHAEETFLEKTVILEMTFEMICS